MRLTLEEMYLEIARIVAKRSTCHRLQVGAVVTNWEMATVWSIGYNGNARGLPNGCESLEPGKCMCLHAETNALIKAPYHQGPLKMFITHTPCKMCAKAIINSAVKEVHCWDRYRSSEGIDLLLGSGIPVHVWDDHG